MYDGHGDCVSSVGSARLCTHHQIVLSLAVGKLHFHKERGDGSQQEMTLLLGSLYPVVTLAPMVILAVASNSYNPVTDQTILFYPLKTE
jgi:hypothetical protein